MNGVMRTLLHITLGIILLGHFAFTQEVELEDTTSEDVKLNRYHEIIAVLDESVSFFPTEPEKSRRSLELARETFEFLSQGGFGSSSVANGINTTFENALSAVTNRSEADLNIQVTVIKGGLQRLLYEVAADEASEGDLDLAKTYFSEIVKAIGGSEDNINQIRESQNPLVFQAVLDSVASQDMQANLQDAADTLQSGNTPEAYQAIAEAYSNYILIQDSPRVSENTSTAFLGAINAVVNEDSEAAESLQDLNNNVNDFVLATETDLEQALTTSETPEATTSDLDDLESDSEEASLEESVPEESPLQVEETEASPEPLEVEPDTDTSLPEIEPVTSLSEVEPEPDIDISLPEVEPATEEPEDEDPSSSLLISPPVANAPVPPAQGTVTPPILTPPVAEPLVPDSETSPATTSLGVGSKLSEDKLNSLYAKVAQATVAIETGEQAKAKESIEGFEGEYKSFFREQVLSEDQEFAEITDKLINSLKKAPALRLQDSVVLMGHVSAIESLLEDKKTSNTHEAIVATSIFWIGILRLIVMIAVAILAFVPLYFLNLAFGGGNRNWQWVGFALFLLLLPVIYEGLSFLGTLIANLTGIEGFNVLSTFSFFQNVISQLVWVIITLIAIIFASIGLYGICVQFGLLGQGRDVDASVFDKDPNVTVSDLGDDTIVDWDEEF